MDLLRCEIMSRITQLWIILQCCLLHKALGQQRFRVEPSDQQGIRGQTILLPCHVDNLVGTVTWVRDGFGLGDERDLPGYSRYRLDGSQDLGEYTLMISNLQLEDDAKYQCQILATKTTPVVVSREATVTVFLPPDDPIIEGGPAVEVVAGVPYNLTCQAYHGKPAGRITWYAGTVPLTEGVYYETSTTDGDKRENATGWATITPKKADQGKRYYCEVHNEGTPPGSPKTTSVSLEVLYPPTVTMSVTPRYDHLSEGDTVTFTCVASGNPDVMTWSWYRDAEQLEGQSSSVLVQQIDRNWHSTKVQCHASNKVGSQLQSVTLNVRYPPRFTSPAAHVAADPQDDATLTCAVDANPEPMIIWSRADDPTGTILSSHRELVVYNVEEADFGVYLCRASIMDTEPIIQAVHLLRKGPPKILSSSHQAARFGEVGIVECQMMSVPKPTAIHWTKDDQDIDFEEMERYQVREEDLPDGKRSMLEITSVQDSDYGRYNCTVENGYGGDGIMISFVKQDVVPWEYIIAGVLVGVLIIIIIAVVIIVYHRKKSSSGSDTDSDTSVSIIGKKPPPGIKVEYHPGAYGTPSIVEAWRHDSHNIYGRRPHGPPALPPPNGQEYDELSIVPPKDPWMTSGPDYRDGNIYGSHYGTVGPAGYAKSDYGTYPGHRAAPYDRYGGSQSIYGGPAYSDYGIYGTYGRHGPPPSSLPPPSSTLPHPAATLPRHADFIPASELGRPPTVMSDRPGTAMSNRLATNV